MAKQTTSTTKNTILLFLFFICVGIHIIYKNHAMIIVYFLLWLLCGDRSYRIIMAIFALFTSVYTLQDTVTRKINFVNEKVKCISRMIEDPGRIPNELKNMFFPKDEKVISLITGDRRLEDLDPTPIECNIERTYIVKKKKVHESDPDEYEEVTMTGLDFESDEDFVERFNEVFLSRLRQQKQTGIK